MRAQSQRLAKRAHVDRCACDRVLARGSSVLLFIFRVIVPLLKRAHVFMSHCVLAHAFSCVADVGGVLCLFNLETGEEQSRYDLPSPAVFNGISAARGQLYLTDEAGSVTCFAKP